MRLMTFAVAVAVLFCAACSRAPAWYDQAPLDGDRWYAVGSSMAGNRDGAAELAKRNMNMRLGQLAAPGPAFRDERLVRLAEGTAAPLAIPVPPQLVVEDAYDTDRSSSVLVSFDRAGWLAKLNQRLQQVDHDLAAADALLPADGGPVAAVRVIRVVAPLWPEREALCAARRQLGESDPQPVVDREAQLARIRMSLTRIPLALDGDQAVAATLPTIRAELFRAGWLAGDTGIVKLKTSLVVSARFIDGLQRLDGILTGDASGEPLRITARADGGDETIARDRLAVKLGEALALELDRRLIRLAEGH